MKKIVFLIVISLFVVGCSQKEVEQSVNENKKNSEITEQKEEYIDDNLMPISLYYDKGTKLILVNNYQTVFKKGTDIGLFQIYPSVEEKISFQRTFGDAFYNAWKTIDQENTYKIGFHLKYELEDGTAISHYVYDPSTSMTYKPYIKVYLYDDYVHRNDSWYSHIEEKDYTTNTYLTSIKLTPGSDISKVSSDILLTVFTYNGKDDFDIDGNYRGISKYSITIYNK